MKGGKQKRVSNANVPQSEMTGASNSTEEETPKLEVEISQNENPSNSKDTGKKVSSLKQGELDSDDEAPESVSLSVSKERAVLDRQKQQEIVSAAKHQEKRLRKEKDDRLRQQKRSRVEHKLSRLPTDVLESVAKKQEVASEQKTAELVEKAGAEVSKSSTKHITFDSEDEGSSDEQPEEEQEQGRGIQIEVLDQPRIEKRKQVFDSASEFLQSHFYGDRLKRIDSMKDMDMKRKAKLKGPALKFSKTIK